MRYTGGVNTSPWNTMHEALLQSKLTRPHAGEHLVARPQLAAWLDGAAARRLIVLAAPTGYGKTALVASWLAKRAASTQQAAQLPKHSGDCAQQAARSTPACAWLSLDAGDNEPLRFWRYVLAACQQLMPEQDQAALAALARPELASTETLLTALLNRLAQLPQQGVLVLDNYQAIVEPALHAAMTFFVSHLPATVQLVILTRSEPPLPLAHLHTRGELAELRAEALRFSPDEAAALLRLVLPTPPSPELTSELVARAEGWPAGLRLAALALRAEPGSALNQSLDAIVGRNSYLTDYLTSEILDAQPAELQSFVLATSGLPRLNGALCDAVTGRSDGALMLRTLAQAGLFLSPLDKPGQWYRYQPLFAEAMRHAARLRLGADQLRATDERASDWYAEHGMPAEAVEVALAAQAYPRAAQQIEALLDRDSLAAELYTLRRWAAQLPNALLPAHPTICLVYAMALLFTEDRTAAIVLHQVEGLLELAEQAWHAPEHAPHLGQALAVRAMALWWHGEHSQAARVSRHALALLPANDYYAHAICQIHLATAALGEGRLSEAAPLALAAQTAFTRTDNRYGQRAIVLVLAEIAQQQGEPEQAEALFRQVAAEAADDRFDQAYALIGRAGLAYGRDELAIAETHAAEALALAAQIAPVVGAGTVLVELTVPAVLLRVRVQRARGAWAEAQRELASLAARTLQQPQEAVRRLVRLEQARLSLELQDRPAVRRWATATAQQRDDVARLQQEREAMLVARWLIAEGETSEALRGLEHWRAEAQADGRIASELELLALIASANASGGRMQQASEMLLALLPQLQARNLRRVLLDAGPPMHRLLRLVAERLGTSSGQQGLSLWVAAVLAAMPGGTASGQGRVGNSFVTPELAVLLAEPLSAQEQRVLRLLGAGLSNPEIAEELIVSVNTVKTHLQSIYRKLGVTSRREARTLLRAR